MAMFGKPDVVKLKEKRNIKGLMKALQYQKDWQIREYAARALGQLNAREAIEELIPLLSDLVQEVRDAASEALIHIGAPAVDALIAALSDAGAREMVARTLVGIGEPAVEPLCKVAEKGWFKHARRYAAWALGEIGDPRAVNALLVTYMDSDTEVRESAARALKRLGESAVGALSTYLKAEDINVRRAAARLLESIEQ
ncbi:MAG: HEAT repeat domain-containing protein [Calditrichaeota bacterium]|nr:MAG: HEAT repeat domain-containing protein [Calditrichota bacterium]